MSLHRRNPKRDASEAAIIEALEALGWSVQPLSIRGGPDLLLGREQQTVLVEVKTGNKPLRPEQEAWHQRWNGSPVVVLRTVDEACQLSIGQWPSMESGKANKRVRRANG